MDISQLQGLHSFYDFCNASILYCFDFFYTKYLTGFNGGKDECLYGSLKLHVPRKLRSLLRRLLILRDSQCTELRSENSKNKNLLLLFKQTNYIFHFSKIFLPI